MKLAPGRSREASGEVEAVEVLGSNRAAHGPSLSLEGLRLMVLNDSHTRLTKQPAIMFDGKMC